MNQPTRFVSTSVVALTLSCLAFASTAFAQGLGGGPLDLPTAPMKPPSLPALSLPDPTMTPGAADNSQDVFCSHPTKERRHLPRGLSDQVADAYSVSRNDIGVLYQLDHLVPLSIGGATVAANLWPQPMAEAYLKDRCDAGVQALVCRGELSVDEARRGIAEDWPTFCREHVVIKAKRR